MEITPLQCSLRLLFAKRSAWCWISEKIQVWALPLRGWRPAEGLHGLWLGLVTESFSLSFPMTVAV